jgi:nuclear factor I
VQRHDHGDGGFLLEGAVEVLERWLIPRANALALLVSLVDSVHPGIALMPSTLGLSTIKLESPAYYCTSYTPPCSEPGSLISSQYPTLSLPRSQSPNSGLSSDTSVIRVKRMRRMSSEGEETELRSGEGGKVGGDLYYSQSPLGQATSSWSQADLDQAASIGRFWLSFTFIERSVSCVVEL